MRGEYLAAVVADVPTSLWFLDEPSGTTAVDNMGAHSATYQGSGNTLGGPFPYSLSVTSSSGGVLVPDSADWTTQQNFSVEIWVYTPSSVAGFNNLFQHQNNSGGWFFFQSGGAFAYQFADGAQPNGGYRIQAAPVLANTLYHIVCTWNNATTAMEIIRNGVISGYTDDHRPGTNPGTFAGSVGIGTDPTGTAGQTGWKIGCAAFYKYVLTTTQALAHYTAAFAPPTIPTANTIFGGGKGSAW